MDLARRRFTTEVYNTLMSGEVHWGVIDTLLKLLPLSMLHLCNSIDLNLSLPPPTPHPLFFRPISLTLKRLVPFGLQFVWMCIAKRWYKCIPNTKSLGNLLLRQHTIWCDSVGRWVEHLVGSWGDDKSEFFILKQASRMDFSCRIRFLCTYICLDKYSSLETKHWVGEIYLFCCFASCFVKCWKFLFP